MATKTEALKKLKKPLIVFFITLLIMIFSIYTLCSLSVNVHAQVGTTATTTGTLTGQTTEGGYLNGLLDVNDNNGTLELVLLITVISLAPSLLILMTSFTRIIIVFSLLRNAMGIQSTPPNQVLIGLSLFLTMFIMTPVFNEINEVAYKGYKAGEFTTMEAADRASVPLKEFMLKQTSTSSMEFFLDLADMEMPTENVAEELKLQVVVPAFIISELKRAFTIGFLLYIPFLIIDIVVASTLMSMGMIMLPPATISMPFKILLFIMINGWELLVGTLVAGFH